MPARRCRQGRVASTARVAGTPTNLRWFRFIQIGPKRTFSRTTVGPGPRAVTTTSKSGFARPPAVALDDAEDHELGPGVGGRDLHGGSTRRIIVSARDAPGAKHAEQAARETGEAPSMEAHGGGSPVDLHLAEREPLVRAARDLGGEADADRKHEQGEQQPEMMPSDVLPRPRAELRAEDPADRRA